MHLNPFRRERPAPVDRIAPTFRDANPENPSTPLSEPASWLIDAMAGGVSQAGQRVGQQTAMRNATVFRCVALKAGVIAALPLDVYKATPTGRERLVNHRLAPLLASQPNDLMSAFNWKELIIANLMLAGNHYSVIEYDQAARVIGLLPVMPQQMRPYRMNGRNWYDVTLLDGTSETYDQADVIHVPGVGFDGVRGISPIEWAGRQPIGTAMAMEEFVGRMHANSMRPSGWMELPKGIKPEGVNRLRAELQDLYAGVGATGKTLLVDAGNKWNPMQMTLLDAQTLEGRHYQVADICRLFGVPSHLVGEAGGATQWGSGIEQLTIGFQKYNVDPDLTRIESELNRKLFTYPIYCEFNRDALNAMDSKAQSELFASAIQNAGMTPNEIRRKRNLPDQPGGDELFIQGATVPLSMAGKVTPAPAPPKDPAAPAPNSEPTK
ncbi:MAG TPA: phage portal protein [Reyranella sp.]|nr:phage portal protein [Reyranella sp.]HTE81990.1 phage portal protein [Reyranella sp.]